MDPCERSEQSCNHGCNALQYTRYHHDSGGLCVQMDDQQWCLYPFQQRGNNHKFAASNLSKRRPQSNPLRAGVSRYNSIGKHGSECSINWFRQMESSKRTGSDNYNSCLPDDFHHRPDHWKLRVPLGHRQWSMRFLHIHGKYCNHSLLSGYS